MANVCGAMQGGEMDGYQDVWMRTGDGLRVHAQDYTNDQAALTVLCLHGLTRNAADFEELAEHLADRHRVVVMEQRGRGDSDFDPRPANYHLGTYVQDATALLDELELERVAVIGTSMGGLMAMSMAAARPERFAGLVINDIGPVVEASGLARIRGYVGKGGPVRTWDDAVAATRANNEAAYPTLTDDEWLAFARRLFRSRPDGTLEPAYDPAIAEPMSTDDAAAVPADLWGLFDSLVAIPMLVVRGELSDILSRQTVAEMGRRHPDLAAVEVPDRGHAPMLTEAPALAAIDGFLSRLAKARSGA